MKNRRTKRYKVCKGCGELSHRAHGKVNGKNCPNPGYVFINVPPYTP